MVSKSARSSIICLAAWTIAAFVLFFTSMAHAEPIGFYESFAGNINFQMTGASLRTESNSGNYCAVQGPSVNSQAQLNLPPGAIVRTAYLYWAGSGSTPDYDVWFENTQLTTLPITLRTFSDTYTSPNWPYTNYDFFSGFADVTTLVNGSGTYRFSGLSVDTGNPYCSFRVVLASWSLVVIYEDTRVGAPLRVINLYDGFQHFRYGQFLRLNPSNFQVPSGGCSNSTDCTWGIVTWEGDPDYGGETLSISAPSSPTRNIFSSLSPSGNQFNSTVDLLGTTPGVVFPSAYGVDIDIFSLNPAGPPTNYLADETSATTHYQAGQDLVLLSAEIISVLNTDVADLSISKTHSSNFTVGQQGVYTIRVTNNGPISHTGQVTVTDTLSAGLTYVSANGPNWSCGAAGQDVTCTTTQGPIASGTRFPDITLTVDVDAAAAPLVTNTAAVTGALFDNITGNNSIPDPTNVFNPNPSTGTKQLYFYMDNAPAADRNTIQRVVNGLNSRSDIGAGSSAIFLLTPALQAPLTLENSPINVDIWLRRIPNGSGTRTATVTLDDNGGPIGTIGTDTISWNSNGMQLLRFSFTPAAVTLAPGTTLRLSLTNEASSSGSTRARSLRSGTRSQIAIDTTTVINVDSVAAYSDVAYPGGVVLSTVAPNTPIRLRAVVTDPFGHDDITSATLTLVDPNSNPVFTNVAMPAVATPPSTPPSLNSTKIFEYGYTIPLTAPYGTWTAVVTANEGTEGTISHRGMGTFNVSATNIGITKTVTTISNPVEGAANAHAIPGAIMQYEIVVTNTGTGPADTDSIIITDPLPEHLRLVLNSNHQPVTFEDGVTTSGLTFNPASVGNSTSPFNDVALSNDSVTIPRPYLPSGALSHDGEGVDNLPNKIDFIRINPKGVFAGSTGVPHPSFTLRFQLKLQ